MALLAGCAGVDRQPDHAFGDRGGALLLLHVARPVVLAHERTFRIVPFEHDDLALVRGQRLRRAVAVHEAEIRMPADRPTRLADTGAANVASAAASIRGEQVSWRSPSTGCWVWRCVHDPGTWNCHARASPGRGRRQDHVDRLRAKFRNIRSCRRDNQRVAIAPTAAACCRPVLRCATNASSALRVQEAGAAQRDDDAIGCGLRLGCHGGRFGLRATRDAANACASADRRAAPGDDRQIERERGLARDAFLAAYEPFRASRRGAHSLPGRASSRHIDRDRQHVLAVVAEVVKPADVETLRHRPRRCPAQ